MTPLERWLVPGLLVAVAVAQCVLVLTRDLSPWKGGGFGMFASTDAPSMRVVSGEAVTIRGETIRVRALRSLSPDRRSSQRAMPSRRGLEALGAELMEMLFVPTSLQDDAAAAKLRAENPDLGWVFDPEDPGVERFYRPVRATDPAHGAAAVRIRALRLRWWRLVFDADEDRLITRPIGAVVELGEWATADGVETGREEEVGKALSTAPAP